MCLRWMVHGLVGCERGCALAMGQQCVVDVCLLWNGDAVRCNMDMRTR